MMPPTRNEISAMIGTERKPNISSCFTSAGQRIRQGAAIVRASEATKPPRNATPPTTSRPVSDMALPISTSRSRRLEGRSRLRG